MDPSGEGESSGFTAILVAIVIAGPVIAVFGFMYALYHGVRSFSAQQIQDLDVALERFKNLDWSYLDEKTGVKKGKTLKWFQTLWLNRLKECVRMIGSEVDLAPGSKIVCIAIAGGRYCDWERGVLFESFGKILGDKFE